MLCNCVIIILAFCPPQQSSGSNKMEEMDEIEIYVAIADYISEEESNIPLYCGQHVQVCVRLSVQMSLCVYVCLCMRCL